LAINSFFRPHIEAGDERAMYAYGKFYRSIYDSLVDDYNEKLGLAPASEGANDVANKHFQISARRGYEPTIRELAEQKIEIPIPDKTPIIEVINNVRRSHGDSIKEYNATMKAISKGLPLP